MINIHYSSALQSFCHHGAPDNILLRLSWNPHSKKFFKHELFVRKPNISLLDLPTNEQLLQKLKASNLKAQLFLHFWNVAIFRIWSFRKKNPYHKYVWSHFLWQLNYIWSALGQVPLTFELHTFAVVIIWLHVGKCAILLHPACLNSRKLI